MRSLRLLLSESGRGLISSTIWVVYLALPEVALWTSDASLPMKLLLTALIIVFVVGYVVFWLVAQHTRWQRRVLLPMTAAASVFGLGLAIVGGPYGFGYVLAYVATVVTLTLLPRVPYAIAGVVAVAGAALLIGLLQRLDMWEVVLEVMIIGSCGAAMFAFWGMARSNESLRAAREEIARLAVAEERLRFSRDLHDLLGHTLSVIVLKAELAHRMAERAPDRSAREAADIERVARDALREVREAVAGYRQPTLTTELQSAAATLEAAGVSVQPAASVGSLPTRVDTVLAWAVREATTNVIRHGRAQRVRFELGREGASVLLRVVNDGPIVPSAVLSSGNGLLGLRERAQALGGEVEFGPLAAGGFSLRTILPASVEAQPAALAT